MFIAASSTIEKARKQLKGPSANEWRNNTKWTHR
jgi:hypothetical protein